MQFTRDDLIHLCFIKKCFDPDKLAHELGISVKTIVRKVPELKTSGAWYKKGPPDTNNLDAERRGSGSTDPVQLRRNRLSYRDIAKSLGTSLSTAYRRVNAVQDKTKSSNPEGDRDIQT